MNNARTQTASAGALSEGIVQQLASNLHRVEQALQSWCLAYMEIFILSSGFCVQADVLATNPFGSDVVRSPIGAS